MQGFTNPSKNLVGMVNRKYLIGFIIVGLWITRALADSLDPFWERKITRGIENYLIKPVQEFKNLAPNAEEYNQVVGKLREIPAWLDKPRDLKKIQEKISAYQKDLIKTINILNQEKIPHLGIFNTTWSGVLIKEINEKEVQNIFRLINRSLEEYQAANQAGRQERICLACIEKLKQLLKTIPFFTTEFKATFSYARGKESIYQGNRLVAGFIEHFKEFNIVNIWWDSSSLAHTLRFTGQREIRWNSAEHPSYNFILIPPQKNLEPAWESLGISPKPAVPGSGGPKSIGYFSLESFGVQELQREIRCALLSFETEVSAKEFWARTEAKIKRHGDQEDFYYFTLEKVSWPGQRGDFCAYGGRFGPYILLVQPRKGTWGERDTEEYQMIKLLINRLVWGK